MRLLDLFCGRWGWSRAFAARGWTCIGIDLKIPPGTPENCIFEQSNVLNITEMDIKAMDVNFIVASSPCEEFSVHGMKHFHPFPKYPEMGIKLFNHTRALCEASGVPYVMENVRAAQQFVGQAVHHCGPFYLWGSGVPMLMPQGIIKGMTRLALGYREHKGALNWNRKYDEGVGRHYWSGSKKRADAVAKNATIPPELANCVADYAERLLEQKVSA